MKILKNESLSFGAQKRDARFKGEVSSFRFKNEKKKINNKKI